MPFYEYRCDQCEHAFEELVGLNDPAPPCPECESGDVSRRVTSRVTVGRASPSPAASLPPGCGGCPSARGPGACALN
jgi:putative FmdB family regulatory protein